MGKSFCGARHVSVVVSPKVCSWSRSCLTAGVGGTAQSQHALPEHGRRLTGSEMSGGDLIGGGVADFEDGVGQPCGGERVVEVAGLLAALDELLEPGADSEVRVATVESWAPVEGGVIQQGVAAEEPPADVEELVHRVDGRGGIKPGGVDGGEAFGSRGFDEGGDQGVARGEVGVDGLAGDTGHGGDVFHAGVGSLAKHGASRVEDGVDATPGVGPA